MDCDRREFFRLGGAVAVGVAAVSLLPGAAQGLVPAQAVDRSGAGPYGPLGAPDDLGLQLPDGFTARIVATGDQPVAGADYVWHVFPDGGAVFPTRARLDLRLEQRASGHRPRRRERAAVRPIR